MRVKIDPSVGFALGPREAPVTIVEFSDFQCPFCRGVVPTLKQLAARYPDRVRLVFRDFPIPSLHPDAPLAHEAARCAGEQGQFWPYHDLLFERTNLNAAALKQYAADLKLDDKKFAECLDSGRVSSGGRAPMWTRGAGSACRARRPSSSTALPSWATCRWPSSSARSSASWPAPPPPRSNLAV